MKKYLLLLPLLLFGCGDDLGWKEKKTDHDCADSVVADAGSSDVVQPQDVSEVNDAGADTNQTVEDSVDATETDISDSSGATTLAFLSLIALQEKMQKIRKTQRKT